MAKLTNTERNTRKLFKFLDDGRFHTSEQIKRRLDIEPVEVRAIAENTKEIIGLNEGYKMAEHADHDELLHAYNQLRSRQRKIGARASHLKMFYL